MKTKKVTRTCVIENKWINPTNDRSDNTKEDVDPALKMPKKSKSFKKLSLKRKRVLRTDAFKHKINSQHIATENTKNYKNHLTTQINHNNVGCSSSNSNDANQQDLHELLALRESQLRRAHEMVRECLQKTREAEKKIEKYSSLELQVVRLKRQLAERCSRDYSLPLPVMIPTETEPASSSSSSIESARPKSCSIDQLTPKEKTKMFLLNASSSIERLRQRCVEEDLSVQEKSLCNSK